MANNKAIGTTYIRDVEDTTGKLEAEVKKADYLLAALEKLGKIEFGLALAHIIGVQDNTTQKNVKAYMNGIVNLNSIAFAAGVDNFGEENETAKALIRHDGFAKFKYGEIGGFNIVEDMLASLNAGMKGAETGAAEPAFWAGGSYEKAINFQEALQAIKDGNIPPDKDYANFIVNHDGSSRLGSFMISDTGDYVLLDPVTKKPAIIFGETRIPPISVLVSGLGSDIVVSNVAKTNINKNEIYKLPNPITSLIPGRKIRFTGKVTVTATVDEGVRYGHRLSLIREPYRYLRTVSLDRRVATGPGRKAYTYTEDIDVTFDNLPDGTYSVNVEAESESATTDISINIGASSLRVFSESSSLNRIQIGPNGLMGWYGNKFMHFTIEEGFQTSNAQTLRYGTVGYNGELKDGSYGNLPNVTKLATGQYKIFHMIGSDKYNLMVTAKVTPGGNVLSAGYTEKHADYIIIEAKNHLGVAEEAEIDFIITRSLI